MEISSHYYALLALCRTKGISKEISHKIAYASQFVDDAKINYLFVDDETDDELFVTNEDDSICMKHIATCHSYFKIKTFNITSMIYNTSAFHFIPGCQGEHFDDKFICRQDSKIINEIVTNNLKSDAEKFGMLMHTYADTFAHQGFSGLLSKKNIIENLEHENGVLNIKIKAWSRKLINKLVSILPWKKEKDLKFKDIIPAYGHGQVYHYPDIPYLKYSFNYNNERHENAKTDKVIADNTKRYKDAFEAIGIYLDKYIEANSLDIQLRVKDSIDEFYMILSKRTGNSRKIKLWRKYLINNNYFDNQEQELKYDENLWLRESFSDFSEDKYQDRVVNSAKLKDGYKEKSWYKFSKAVKDYKLELVDVLKRNGINIPK